MNPDIQKTEERSLFGFWLYILSDCVLFAGLFAAFAVLRGETYGGPTGESLLNLPFVLTETIILLLSSYAMGLTLLVATKAPLAQKEGKTWPSGLERTLFALGGLCISFLLGLVFLGLELSEFRGLVALGTGPGRSAFLSAFFALVGTHGLHVAAGMLWMILIAIHLSLRGLTPSTARKLRMLALFWHFLDIIWIFIFTLVYLLSAAL